MHVEESGTGAQLLCLHTSGSDSRQFRHLLNDNEVLKRWRVIAFDLPWHCKSSPPEGFQNEIYELTPDHYNDTIMAVVSGLALSKPVVMGCSIGGRVVLHLLLRHAKEIGAAIGLQSSRHGHQDAPDNQAHAESDSSRPPHVCNHKFADTCLKMS